MWKLTSDRRPGDLRRLTDALRANAEMFDRKRPITAARAPGRLDLMGGIADYSGALVLELPLAVATYAAVQTARQPTLTVRSLSPDAVQGDATVVLPLEALAPAGRPIDYDAARALLSGTPALSWSAYVLGPLLVLMREAGLQLKTGLTILVTSNVPPGKGVSSSAAIEVATMTAIAALTRTKLDGRRLAMLCQRAENLVVGAPCGVMDQMTSACGVRDSLLALRCQPAELDAPVKLPRGLAVWGIDSGVRHAVSGADYTSVRVGAFMGYRIIADVLGLSAMPASPDAAGGRVTIHDPRTRGYLANISPSEWTTHLRDKVPASMRGAAFLERYGGLTDTVTRISPAVTYAVRQPTAHPIFENHRVHLFRELLRARPDADNKRLLGELMFQSHASYSECGLGSSATDQLVELVRRDLGKRGLWGAKITGGGSGGTVAVLGDADAGPAVARIAEEYGRITGRQPEVLRGSSDGATAVGPLVLSPV